MNTKRAVEKYIENIHLSLSGEKEFRFILCNQSCKCIMGVEWYDMKFLNPHLTQKNGFKIRFNWKTGNLLEDHFLELVKDHYRIQLQIERNKKLNEII
jgi:hypothetical protein